MKRFPAPLFRLAMLIFIAGFFAVSAVEAQNQLVQRTTDLPLRRAFGGSAVLGDYVYYLGGSQATGDGFNTESISSSVVRARILSNGRLGSWEQTTPLPQPRHYIENATLVLNDVVYVIGGSSLPANGERYNTALFSRPLPNGTLLPWTESQPFSRNGLSTITAVSTPGHIHIIGGLDKQDGASNKVFTNTIYADGSMGSWVPGPVLPMPLWYHSAGAASGRVYVWGGMPGEDRNKVSPLMFSAPILGSGKLGPWRREARVLPHPFYGASTAVAGDYLISFSPRYAGSVGSSDVWYAAVTPQGISNWYRRHGGVPNQVYHAAATDYRRGAIYFGGGRNNQQGPMLQNFFSIALGSSARDQAERAWLAAQRAHQNTVSAFPAPGTDTEERQTTLTYTAAATLSDEAVQGFKTYGDARTDAESQRLPLVVYFALEDARPCVEQRELLESPEFQQIVPKASWAWVETKNYPQLAQQIGVYRVPTWVFYDETGNEVQNARTVGVKSVTDLAKAVLDLR